MPRSHLDLWEQANYFVDADFKKHVALFQVRPWTGPKNAMLRLVPRRRIFRAPAIRCGSDLLAYTADAFG
jgi:hypothetical protein